MIIVSIILWAYLVISIKGPSSADISTNLYKGLTYFSLFILKLIDVLHLLIKDLFTSDIESGLFLKQDIASHDKEGDCLPEHINESDYATQVFMICKKFDET